MTAYDSKTGEVTSSSNIVDLFGYVFPLNPGKTLEYITGFNDNAIKILEYITLPPGNQPG